MFVCLDECEYGWRREKKKRYSFIGFSRFFPAALGFKGGVYGEQGCDPISLPLSSYSNVVVPLFAVCSL